MEELNLWKVNPIPELEKLASRYSETISLAARRQSPCLARTEQTLSREWQELARTRMGEANLFNWQASNRRTLLEGLAERLQGCIAFLEREEKRGDLAPGFVAELQTELAQLREKYLQGMEREQRREDSLFRLIARLKKMAKEGPFLKGGA